MKTQAQILDAIHNCNLRLAMCMFNTNDEGRHNGTLESFAFATALQWVLGIEGEGPKFFAELMQTFDEMSPEQRDALSAMHVSITQDVEEVRKNASS